MRKISQLVQHDDYLCCILTIGDETHNLLNDDLHKITDDLWVQLALLAKPFLNICLIKQSLEQDLAFLVISMVLYGCLLLAL